MIINEIMPSYDVRELHWRVMRGTQAAIYSRIRTKDLGSSRLIRWLFKFRGLPESALSIDGLIEVGFIRLAEEPGREFMVGIIGRFWKGSGDLKKVSPTNTVRSNSPVSTKPFGTFPSRLSTINGAGSQPKRG
ncbi:MAG: hypothetical protein WBD30_11645 [Bacteroidota bacterium]